MEEPVIAAIAPMVISMEPGDYWWCACGKSANQPFCTGAHKGTSFSPVKVEISETKKVAWCMCKHSKNKPYCDGSHLKL